MASYSAIIFPGGKRENPEGGEGHRKNPFCGGYMDIFWNYTMWLRNHLNSRENFVRNNIEGARMSKNFFQSASWKRHCTTHWREQYSSTLIENSKLVNQIARLAATVVEFNTPLFRSFYDHLSNYTKTITRLRLVNIGEYSLPLQWLIVKYFLYQLLYNM